jgi:hypothetical protein
MVYPYLDGENKFKNGSHSKLVLVSKLGLSTKKFKKL